MKNKLQCDFGLDLAWFDGEVNADLEYFYIFDANIFLIVTVNFSKNISLSFRAYIKKIESMDGIWGEF